MPKTHTHTTYNFDELTTQAQDKALEEIAGLLAGGWWDSSDNDDIGETLLYSLAASLESPGWNSEDHGPADFPGIDGLEVEGWDLDHDYKLSGCLTPTTAPKLPWPPKAQQYVFSSRHNGAYIEVEVEDEESVWTEQIEPPQNFADAIQTAISDALKAGQNEYKYKTGKEGASSYIDGNDPRFNEDGTLHI